MKKPLLIGSVFIIDTLFCLFCFLHLSERPVLLLYWSGHLVLSFLLARIICLSLPKKYPYRRLLTGLVTGLLYFIPILGFLSVVAMLLYWKTLHVSARPVWIKPLEKPIIEVRAQNGTSAFGMGGAYERLVRPNISEAQRTMALLAISSIDNTVSNRLLQKNLESTLDEVRLLSFSILDTKERKITEEIARLKKYPEKIKELGLAYWELIYTGLVGGRYREQIINRCLECFSKALELRNNDPQMLMALGRIYLIKRQLGMANDYFCQAIANGYDMAKVSPYLAELAYLRRDFSSVRGHMKMCRELDCVPKMAAIVRLWSGQYDATR